MLRWLTAGESHGPALVAILEGLPAGVEVSRTDLGRALARRRENEELISAQRRAQQLYTANLRMVSRLRGECLTSLQNLIKLGQNIIESPNLKDAQAFGRLVQTETQCALDVVEELISDAEAKPAKH